MVKFELDEYHRNVTDDELLEDLCRIAAIATEGRVTRDGYKLLGGRYSSATIERRFGSWNKALALAELGFNNRMDISDEELLEDLRRVAVKANKGRVTIPVYKLLGGKYSAYALARRFGSWNKALVIAGLGLNHRNDIPEQELLEDLRHVAAKLGTNSITGEAYSVNGGRFVPQTFQNKFQTWNKALELAGLVVVHRYKIPDDELLSNIESVWRHLARQPRVDEMKPPISKFGAATYRYRFGTWRKALAAFISFVNKDEKDADVSDEELSASEVLSAVEPSEVVQTPTRSTRHINWRTRFLVMRRDDFKCRYCGRSPSNNPGLELHIDHVKAWSKDGPTTMDNLRTACNVCNIGKSDLDVEELA